MMNVGLDVVRRWILGDYVPKVNNVGDIETLLMNGNQFFRNPQTIDINGATVDDKGWIPIPKNNELIIRLSEIKPDENIKRYFIMEKIITDDTVNLKVSLERSRTFNEETQEFESFGVCNNYIVSANNQVNNRITIMQNKGESLRLKVHPISGASKNFYFNFQFLEQDNGGDSNE